MKKLKRKREKVVIVIIVVIILIIISVPLYRWEPMNRILAFLDAWGIVLAIVTAIVSFMTWINVQRLSARFQIPDAESFDKEHAATLVVSVGCGDILEQVRNYWIQKEGEESRMISGTPLLCRKHFENGPIQKAFFSINYGFREKEGQVLSISSIQKALSKEEMTSVIPDLYDALDGVNGFLKESGVTTVHVFYRGPVTLGFFIGDELGNNYEARIYQYDGNGYYFVGVMNRRAYINGAR